MIQKIVVTWSYEPADYFQEEFVVEHEGHEITIGAGRAEVALRPEHADVLDHLLAVFTAALETRLLLIQATRHEAIKLSEPSRYDVNEDGTRNLYASVEFITVATAFAEAHVQLLDADGNVLVDTRKQKTERERGLAELAAKHGDDRALKQMLLSYSAAISDPQDELVHLYEVRETAIKAIGNASEARSSLALTRQEWSDFGRITCNEPLRQGRHRGQNFESLRDATPEELGQVREVARKIIEGYLKYLDRKRS